MSCVCVSHIDVSTHVYSRLSIDHRHGMRYGVPTEYRLFYRALLQKRPIISSITDMRCSMGWLRFVGSIKLQVSFAEYRLFYRALLQKRPVILSILLTEATPYPHMWTGILSVESCIHTTPEASWRRGLDPLTPLLFDLYH